MTRMRARVIMQAAMVESGWKEWLTDCEEHKDVGQLIYLYLNWASMRAKLNIHVFSGLLINMQYVNGVC